MYWPDDNDWYAADIVGYDPASKQHRLWYHIDEQYEVSRVPQYRQQQSPQSILRLSAVQSSCAFALF